LADGRFGLGLGLLNYILQVLLIVNKVIGIVPHIASSIEQTNIKADFF
jgi:hypothetical protein